MAYGTFNKARAYGYDCYTYSEGGLSYTVHIFKTNPATMGVVGAVYEQRKNLSQMNPNSAVCAPSQMLAKTNGNYLDNTSGGKAFYGMFYSEAANELSYDGSVNIQPTDSLFANTMYDANFYRVSPSMGINSVTNTASIRWPNYYGGANRLTPAQMMDQYDVIIAGQHCLVHNGKSVFESICYSWEGITIADWSNLTNQYNHHNESIGGGNSKTQRARTFFGHSSDGACYMVCVEGDTGTAGTGAFGMTLKTGARLMCDLGCDYALNMDGGSPTQMRVASEGGIVYSRMSGGGYTVGSAICAYSKY